MSYLIECKNLTAGYEGMPVVKDLSFNVSAGDYLCIVGENGSGKSTLMKTILGLRSALSGEIIFGDGLKQTEIGYLPQQTAAQKDFPATVREVVLSGCLGRKGLSPFYSKADKKLCDDNIELLGITGIARRSYRNLSGGQQQRVLLARALCATGKLLLLDEPVSGLDPMVTAEMYEIISRLNREQGITIIMISHDLQGALKYGEKENLTVLPHLLPCYISAAKMISGKLGTPRKKHLRLYVVLFIAVGKFGNIFNGILSAIHNDLPVNKTSHKYLRIRGSVAYLLSLGTILSIPPIYFLRTSGIFTLPSAQRLFSRNAISILGGATTVLLSVCAK